MYSYTYVLIVLLSLKVLDIRVCLYTGTILWQEKHENLVTFF